MLASAALSGKLAGFNRVSACRVEAARRPALMCSLPAGRASLIDAVTVLSLPFPHFFLDFFYA
jgi:hypothetical protein